MSTAHQVSPLDAIADTWRCTCSEVFRSESGFAICPADPDRARYDAPMDETTLIEPGAPIALPPPRGRWRRRRPADDVADDPPAEIVPAPDPAALCEWGHAELGRLTTMAELIGQYGRRWRARSNRLRAQGDSPAATATADTIDDMLADLGAIMARPGRKGPHADHLLAAQWHLNMYVGAQRGPRR